VVDNPSTVKTLSQLISERRQAKSNVIPLIERRKPRWLERGTAKDLTTFKEAA
jgi:hypothetical protein